MKYRSNMRCEKLDSLYSGTGIAETPDDGRLGPKHVVKGRSNGSNCIIDGIILCMQDILMQQDA
jgi:hypothetical protein